MTAADPTGPGERRPRAGKVEREMTPEDREWLDAELRRREPGWGYRELEAALAERGYEITYRSLHRYNGRRRAGEAESERWRQRVELSTALASAITEAAGEDPTLMGRALAAGIQEQIFDLFERLEGVEDTEQRAALLANASLILARTVRAQAWAGKEQRAALQRAAGAVRKAAADRGLSDEAAQEIVAAITASAGAATEASPV